MDAYAVKRDIMNALKVEELPDFDRSELEDEEDWRDEAKWLEQQLMVKMDEYADVAAAMGFERGAWFGDPLASHKEVVERAAYLWEYYKNNVNKT